LGTIAAEEQSEIDEANASRKTPVIFIHGLWLLSSSRDKWAAVFADAGYAPRTPGWPDDPHTVEEAKTHPRSSPTRGSGMWRITASVIEALDKKPAVIGHSFGVLLAQIVAGRGLSAATVAIDAAPFCGVVPLPISALRSPARSWRTRATSIEPSH
jgi:pimeloyl-ACP methyl ester carboxylesterase